jgi:hypothetical protein
MTDTTNESAPLLIYPRPTPSTPGAPVEGREDADDLLDAEDYAAAHADEGVSVRIRSLAAEVRRLRSALAEAQRDGERLDWPEVHTASLHHNYTGRADNVSCIVDAADFSTSTTHFGATYRAAIDAARSPREDATTSTTEG